MQTKLSLNKHGFIRHCSTFTNLLSTYFYVHFEISQYNSCDLVSIDLAKAFDKVPKDILISKLQCFGIDSKLVNLIYIILTNRKQQVKIENIISDMLPVTSGVPQGSQLSPLLFINFIYDLFKLDLSSKIIGFADDLKLVNSSAKNLANDLLKIAHKVNINGMSINVEKCTVIHFGAKNSKYTYSINSKIITSTSQIRDLGILVDDDLKFSSQLDALKMKSYRTINIIIKFFKIRNAILFKRLYKIYVLPIILYCLPIYFTNTRGCINGIEKIQKYFTRRLYKLIYKAALCPKYSDRLKLFNLVSLDSLCKKRFARFVFCDKRLHSHSFRTFFKYT